MSQNLNQLFNLIKLSDSTLSKDLAKEFVTELWYNTILNIVQKRDRPDLDRTLYSYKEPSMTVKKAFECTAAIQQSILFDCELSWKFNSFDEEYTEMKFKLNSCYLSFLNISFKMSDYIPMETLEKDLLNLANGLTVVNWE